MREIYPELKDLGGLGVLKVIQDPNSPYIVLFHGYGANAYDLFPLHQAVQVKQNVNWIFPDGFLEIPIAPGYIGKAWFPIDIEALQRALMTGSFRDFSEKYPEGLEEARIRAMEMLKALNVPMNQIILGGFSQGAMLATELTLQSQEKPRGLIILSGTLLNQKEWAKLASKKSSLTFFQSHGRSDPILSYQAAKDLNELLRDAGMVGEFISFPGGHEIPYEVIDGMNRYLATII